MSQFSNFGTDEDFASSTFLGDVNEDLCYGLPYTPLGERIQASFKVGMCYPSKAITWNSCQTNNQQSYLWLHLPKRLWISWQDLKGSQISCRTESMSLVMTSYRLQNFQIRVGWWWQLIVGCWLFKTTLQNGGSFRWSSKPPLQLKDTCIKGQATFGGFKCSSNPRTSNNLEFVFKSLYKASSSHGKA